MGWPITASDYGKDGKLKSALDYEKIQVVCARCGTHIKAERPYICTFDRFDVRVNFFGWTCEQSIDGAAVRAVSKYEVAFDHCGCMKIDRKAPWQDSPESIAEKPNDDHCGFPISKDGLEKVAGSFIRKLERVRRDVRQSEQMFPREAAETIAAIKELFKSTFGLALNGFTSEALQTIEDDESI